MLSACIIMFFLAIQTSLYCIFRTKNIDTTKLSPLPFCSTAPCTVHLLFKDTLRSFFHIHSKYDFTMPLSLRFSLLHATCKMAVSISLSQFLKERLFICCCQLSPPCYKHLPLSEQQRKRYYVYWVHVLPGGLLSSCKCIPIAHHPLASQGNLLISTTSSRLTTKCVT